jgi:hypothetical protein
VTHTAEILASSIVCVGDFNPAIFSPDWLERNELIGRSDADAVREGSAGKSLLVSHQVSSFETKWFSLQVLENQFALTSKDALSPAFKDLAAGIFQLVPHTPVAAVGLNFSGHFKLSDEEAYHRVGDVLAPKDVWQTLYPDEMPGLADLTIRVQRGTRGEPLKSKDEKRISVQPSQVIKFGAFLTYNDHHDVSVREEGGPSPAERVAAIIDSTWEAAWRDAVRVFDGVLTWALRKVRTE